MNHSTTQRSRCRRPSSVSATLVGALALALAAGTAFAHDEDDDDDRRSRKGRLDVTAYCPAASLTDIIARAPRKGELRVKVVGICHENVEIRRSRTTVYGDDPATSQIVGVPETDVVDESPVTVLGAQSVRLESLTIRGGESSGVAIINSLVRVIDSVLEENGIAGVSAGAGIGIVEGSLIRNNREGVRVLAGGMITLVDSAITGNANEGVRVLDGGNVRVGIGLDGVEGPVTVSDNGTDGVLALNSSHATVRGSTIERNGDDGVEARRASSAIVLTSTIRANGRHGVLASQNSSVLAVDDEIRDNAAYELIAVDGGNFRLESNTVTDDSVNDSVGAALGGFRGASIRLVGGNSLVQQNAAASALAMSVFHNSDLRQDTGSGDVVTGPRAIQLGNFATVDFRQDFTINGDVDASSFGSFRVRGTGVINGDIQANSPLATASESGGNVTLNGTCSGNCFGF